MAARSTVGSALVVDPDAEERERLAGLLETNRLQVEQAATARIAKSLLDERVTDVVLCAPALPDGPVDAFLAEVTAAWPEAHVVALVAADSATAAVDAMRAGASEILLAPPDAEALSYVVDKALKAIERIEAPPHALRASGTIIGDSPSMRKVEQTLAKAAKGHATVLIRGESGTGKELVARELHAMSERRDGPFVKVHCAALPDALLESELFGYAKGAFTGAAGDKPGRVELAQGGTLFLDEIGDIPALTQVKLLRLLQDKQYERLGDGQVRDADVRFVTATHRDLEAMVKRGDFREDLFYRLNVVPLWLPPLRTRRGDVGLLATRFCERFAKEHGRPDLRLEPEALEVLTKYRWPGNVRQLQNVVERLAVLSDRDLVDAAAVKAEIGSDETFATASVPTSAGAGTSMQIRSQVVVTREPLEPDVVPLADTLLKAEKEAIERALEHTKGNRSLAAKLLGVSRGTLYNKLALHGLR